MDGNISLSIVKNSVSLISHQPDLALISNICKIVEMSPE